MLLFNLCDILKRLFIFYFNTSNVTIQRDKKLVKVWENNISIHLMLLFNGLIRNSGSLFLPDFNTSNVTIQPWRSGVGLQPCHISIHLMLLFNCYKDYLSAPEDNFNTSNVTIQLSQFCEEHNIEDNFNTSNVTIQHNSIFNTGWHIIISIHLMLLFN